VGAYAAGSGDGTTSFDYSSSWTISGAAYGNGNYLTTTNSVHTNDHPPGDAFDWGTACCGWHTQSRMAAYLTIEFPEPVTVGHYTLSMREDCCVDQQPAG
jgi:hypothetical protein